MKSTHLPSITIPLIVLKTKLVAVGSGITTVFGGIAAKLGPVFTQIGTIASKFGAVLSSVLKVAVSFGGQFTSVLMKAFGFGAIAGLVLVGLTKQLAEFCIDHCSCISCQLDSPLHDS